MNDVDGAPTLADLIAMKEALLSDPGCWPDYEQIQTELGLQEDQGVQDEVLLSTWFDRIVEDYRDVEEIMVYRHLTVPDFDAFVGAIEAGVAAVGAHWSDSALTWSDHAQALGCDILLAGRVSAYQVDWLSTMQAQFSFPNEREVVFSGPVLLDGATRIHDGFEWVSGGLTVETSDGDADLAPSSGL